MTLRDRYDQATAHLDPPFAAVDMDALRANAADLVRRARGKPIRIASKSVRCRPLLEQVLAMDGFSGVMSFTLPEALWLSRQGVTDILVAYPTVDRAALSELAADEQCAREIAIMVDCVEHLDLIDAVSGRHPIRVCMDIDAAWHAAGGRVRIGALRSPIVSADQAAALAKEIVRRPGLRLVGLMAYESQIAGVGDNPPGKPLYSRAIRFVQAQSRVELARRRGAIVAAVRDIADDSIEFVNGGGTGSVEKTAAEKAVTEVAAGSGLYQSTLFDHYTNFSGRPAAIFALPVVRRPGPGVVTVLGGGYVASGVADKNRLPQPYLPAGLRLDSKEGAGEVQTPLLGAATESLEIGDRVWFRHAKAGELCERFAELHLIENDRVVDTVPTYRGEGRTFL
jgi:D-serine deaminase-like pyridoxal phosphate-dependent protein